MVCSWENEMLCTFSINQLLAELPVLQRTIINNIEVNEGNHFNTMCVTNYMSNPNQIMLQVKGFNKHLQFR